MTAPDVAALDDEFGHALHHRFYGGVDPRGHNTLPDGEPMGDCYKCRIVRDWARDYAAAQGWRITSAPEAALTAGYQGMSADDPARAQGVPDFPHIDVTDEEAEAFLAAIADPPSCHERIRATLEGLRAEADEWDADAEAIEASASGTPKSRRLAAEALRTCARHLRDAIDARLAALDV